MLRLFPPDMHVIIKKNPNFLEEPKVQPAPAPAPVKKEQPAPAPVRTQPAPEKKAESVPAEPAPAPKPAPAPVDNKPKTWANLVGGSSRPVGSAPSAAPAQSAPAPAPAAQHSAPSTNTFQTQSRQCMCFIVAI